MEELIAELGSAYCCAQLKISPQPREDHAEYIAGGFPDAFPFATKTLAYFSRIGSFYFLTARTYHLVRFHCNLILYSLTVLGKSGKV